MVSERPIWSQSAIRKPLSSCSGLADSGITPDQAAQEIRRLRTTRQDIREARRATLNAPRTNEAGGILNRLGINPGGRTLDRRRVQSNFAWLAYELHRRVNEWTEGSSDDRQNFTLEQLNAGHDALPEIVQRLEEELRDAASEISIR